MTVSFHDYADLGELKKFQSRLELCEECTETIGVFTKNLKPLIWQRIKLFRPIGAEAWETSR